jgi:hypothetical protein
MIIKIIIGNRSNFILKFIFLILLVMFNLYVAFGNIENYFLCHLFVSPSSI